MGSREKGKQAQETAITFLRQSGWTVKKVKPLLIIKKGNDEYAVRVKHSNSTDLKLYAAAITNGFKPALFLINDAKEFVFLASRDV